MEGEREVNSNLIGLKRLGKINCCILVLFSGLHLGSYTGNKTSLHSASYTRVLLKQSLTSGQDAKILAGNHESGVVVLVLIP